MAERNASDEEDESYTLPSSPPTINHGYQPTYIRDYGQYNYAHTPNSAVSRPSHPQGAQSHTFLDPQYYYQIPRPPVDPQTGYPQPPFGFWPLAPRPDVIAHRDANLALQQPLLHAHHAPTPARNTVADNITTAPSSPPHASPEVQAAHILLRMRNSAPITLSRRGSPVSPEKTPTTGSEKEKETEDETELESEDETEEEDDDDDDDDYVPRQ